MARRSQCSDAGDNPHDLNYLPPHYREEYRMAIDALIEEDVEGYYKFLQFVDVVDFLAPSEIDYIQNCVQIPKQSTHPEHRYLDTTGDGSSDTYWPMHSDLDAPGLDLGWPQIHHFIGPTEVTTLVNPAAPDMPSIKEQARRLIKNAQMVIAVVMDMFTDVDIFADILNATTRNVAVYLLLDEANVQYFINMVNNCRVNLQAIQFLRVRTVTGIRYHCRTGKSFKGQMLDRFILTDCRAVLSGNYSFMWSYEKLHRCMAHLFLGQMVSTFDEEFRILFAQSEPLDLKRMEDMTVLPSRPCPGDRPMLRDPRKYRTMDPGQPEEWNRPPYEENMDWRMGPLKRHDTFQGPMDMYNRYPSPQSVQTRLEPPFDQGPPRMMEALAHKRHGFAEGGPGRYNLPYQQPQPGLPEVEPPGRPFYRGQQHLHPGHDPDYEPYPEPGYPREIDPHENFDPVLNYLSSARNVEMEQSSDKLIPSPDLPYATTHPRRHIGQPYACQTSPTPSNTTEKRFMQDHSSDRKDPTVKRGLRNWRISSYLSAYDSSGEPEGLPMGHGQVVDPFDDMPHPMQQPTPPPPQAIELAVPKIPNVREFKVPALPRASQMPSEKQVEGTTQIAAVESSTSVATSKVDETKMADKASEMSTESSTKDVSNIQSETSKESISTEVKTQDLTSQSETNAGLNKDIVVSPGTSEEKEETKMEEKPAEITVKDTSKSLEASKESRIDDKSLDPKISVIEIEDETCSTNQSRTNPVSNVTSESLKLETNTKKVYSRFQVEPSNASAETNANMVTSKVTEKVKIADTTSEFKSDSTIETSLESKIEGIGQNLEASEAKQAASNENKVEPQDSTTTQEAKTVEKTTEIITKEPSTAEENIVLEKVDSKTVTPSNTNDETPSVNKEMSKSAGGENEQKSKDANDNTKENTSTSDSAKVIETAPPTAQPKQQQKSRYLSSTANVISSSNLRDDTKILLEQISANSQTRNESNPAKEAPVTDEEKEDEADKNGKCKNDLRSSMGQQKTSQERDKLLERIQTMRKDRKVYSRFEFLVVSLLNFISPVHHPSCHKEKGKIAPKRQGRCNK
uniref:Scaffolding anchor of CK1 domain-containing protein n=1 Tax=Periophthalmus magnuspinnatus TaxID=409849 RepID=A0A3B4BES3_9GOBI